MKDSMMADERIMYSGMLAKPQWRHSNKKGVPLARQRSGFHVVLRGWDGFETNLWSSGHHMPEEALWTLQAMLPEFIEFSKKQLVADREKDVGAFPD
jgi:hypothetical protein